MMREVPSYFTATGLALPEVLPMILINLLPHREAAKRSAKSCSLFTLR